eukprot:4894081-Pleurochrysis_carterae.AAC.2
MTPPPLHSLECAGILATQKHKDSTVRLNMTRGRKQGLAEKHHRSEECIQKITETPSARARTQSGAQMRRAGGGLGCVCAEGCRNTWRLLGCACLRMCFSACVRVYVRVRLSSLCTVGSLANERCRASASRIDPHTRRRGSKGGNGKMSATGNKCINKEPRSTSATANTCSVLPYPTAAP